MFSLLLTTYQAGIYEGEFLRAEEHVIHSLHTYRQAGSSGNYVNHTKKKIRKKGRKEGKEYEMKEGTIEEGVKIGEQKGRK